MMSRKIYGSGEIIKPEDYFAHWEIEFLNGEKIRMFNNNKKVGVFENIIRDREDHVLFAIWKPLNNRMPRIGLVKKESKFSFIIGSELLTPIDNYYLESEKQFIRIFIRNNIIFKTNNRDKKISEAYGSLEYHVEIKCLKDKNFKTFGISWDGSKITNHNFCEIFHIGCVEIT